MRQFAIICVWFLGITAQAAEPVYHDWNIVNADGSTHTVHLEHAKTPRQLTRGLMFRLKLDEDKGMAFIYPKPHEVAMWMKNTYLPLDIVYLNDVGGVVSMVENTTPLSLKALPSRGATKVAIELNAGAIKRLGITEDSRFEHKEVFKK